jgi:hypothetical protein
LEKTIGTSASAFRGVDSWAKLTHSKPIDSASHALVRPAFAAAWSAKMCHVRNVMEEVWGVRGVCFAVFRVAVKIAVSSFASAWSGLIFGLASMLLSMMSSSQ